MTSLPWLNDQVKPTLIKHTSSFLAVYYKKHLVGFPAIQVVGNPNNPKHIEISRRWASRDRNALWWHVLCSQAAHPKAVVRVWFTRRVRTAFREELRLRNMDVNCRPLEDGKPTEAPALITGYLRLQVRGDLREAKYTQIRKDCGRTIDELMVGKRARSTRQQPSNGPADAQQTPPGRHLAPQLPALRHHFE
jgi:hypothetical protein